MKKLNLSWNACKNLFKKVTFIIVGSTIIFSCKKEMPKPGNLTNNTKIVSTAKINPTIKTENGVIVFATQDDFNMELMNTYKITNADRIVWENSHNFKSLHTIYNEICKAEYETCLKPYENVSEEEAQKIITPEHTAIFYEAVNNGIVKVVKNNDGSESQALNCSQMNFAPFLSADGIVAINNDLYQYRDDKAKQFKNAQPTSANIEKLKTVTVSNESEGLIVNNVNEKSRASGNIYFGQWQTGQWGNQITTNGLYSPQSLYRVVFDLSYNFSWSGIAINRASTNSFNASMVLKTEKKKNKLASKYYIYPGDHYVQSLSIPFSFPNSGNVYSTPVVDINGNQLYSSGNPTPFRTYFSGVTHTINANDVGQGNGQMAISFASGYAQAPMVATAPLGLTQGYFSQNPTPFMKWNLKGVVPGGSSGFTVYNVKN